MSSQCGARRSRGRGGGYGVGAPLSVGALEYVANNTSNVGKTVGARRKSKKKKAGRRTRRKTRGGGSVATVGYGYVGTGSRGLADPKAYNSNPLPDGGFMSK
jgi:hypothetical protein